MYIFHKPIQFILLKYVKEGYGFTLIFKRIFSLILLIRLESIPECLLHSPHRHSYASESTFNLHLNEL